MGHCSRALGAFDQGFDDAGFQCVWQVEKEPSCISVLERHWPNVARHTDIATAKNLEFVDVICGGWPCQDLSVAGKRAGLNGDRSGLFFEFIRIIDETKPSYVVWENVPGLLSASSGRDFATVISELERVGYCGAWTTLDARWFGLAQRRRRVFGVFALASIGAERCAEILSLSARMCWHPETRREARARVAACLDGSPYADREAEDNRLIGVPDVAWALQERDAKGADSDTKEGHLIVTASLTAGMSATPGVNRPGRRREDDENLVCAALNSGGFRTEPGEHLVTHSLNSQMRGATEDGTGRGIPLVAHALSAEGADASEDGTGRGTPIVIDRTNITSPGNYSNPAPIVAFRACGQDGFTPLAAGAFGVRRLTPRECERLQGFDDDWTRYDSAGKEISDSARYRMLGNAVAVPVARWIAKRIVEFSK